MTIDLRHRWASTAVPDLAYATGTPAESAYAPAVVDDDGSGEPIALILSNNRDMYVAGRYLVHPAIISRTGQSGSDHHLVTCTLNSAA
jgi:hypothetical protein